jgi:hypothetical protein
VPALAEELQQTEAEDSAANEVADESGNKNEDSVSASVYWKHGPHGLTETRRTSL